MMIEGEKGKERSKYRDRCIDIKEITIAKGE